METGFDCLWSEANCSCYAGHSIEREIVTLLIIKNIKNNISVYKAYTTRAR